jgi:hypothetical protein
MLRRIRTVVAIAIVLACGSPSEPCACPPVPFTAQIIGSVTTASGQPVANATVLGYAGPLPCPATRRWPDTLTATSGTTGEYSQYGYAAVPGVEFCLRVVAFRSATDSAVAQRIVVDSTSFAYRMAVLRLDIVFPN